MYEAHWQNAHHNANSADQNVAATNMLQHSFLNILKLPDTCLLYLMHRTPSAVAPQAHRLESSRLCLNITTVNLKIDPWCVPGGLSRNAMLESSEGQIQVQCPRWCTAWLRWQGGCTRCKGDRHAPKGELDEERHSACHFAARGMHRRTTQCLAVASPASPVAMSCASTCLEALQLCMYH